MLIPNAQYFLPVMVTDHRTVYVDITWYISLATSLSKRTCMYRYTPNRYYLYISDFVEKCKKRFTPEWRQNKLFVHLDIKIKHIMGANIKYHLVDFQKTPSWNLRWRRQGNFIVDRIIKLFGLIIVSMAVNDLLPGVFVFDFTIMMWMVDDSVLYCQIQTAITFWFIVIPIMHVIPMNIDRYVFIMHPFLYKRYNTRLRTLACMWPLFGFYQ